MNKSIITACIGALAAAFVVAIAPVAKADEECQDVPRVVAVGPTSCQFALNVYAAMMNGGGTAFSAYSPVTGENYWMTCMIEHHGSQTCRGGDGAQVDIY